MQLFVNTPGMSINQKDFMFELTKEDLQVI